MWFLARRGKDRGYSDKIDIEKKTDNSEITVKFFDVDGKPVGKLPDKN
jgi:hypothetical protein